MGVKMARPSGALQPATLALTLNLNSPGPELDEVTYAITKSLPLGS